MTKTAFAECINLCADKLLQKVQSTQNPNSQGGADDNDFTGC